MLWRLLLGALLLLMGLVLLMPLGLIWSPALFGYYTVGWNTNISALRQLATGSALGGAACAMGVMFFARGIGLRRRRAARP
jgi:hypothetical protein